MRRPPITTKIWSLRPQFIKLPDTIIHKDIDFIAEFHKSQMLKWLLLWMKIIQPSDPSIHFMEAQMQHIYQYETHINNSFNQWWFLVRNPPPHQNYIAKSCQNWQLNKMHFKFKCLTFRRLPSIPCKWPITVRSTLCGLTFYETIFRAIFYSILCIWTRM